MRGSEIRKLAREISSETSIFRIPQSPFSSPFPLIQSDFSYYGQRIVKSYAAVFSGDFYRNFRGRCYICTEKIVAPQHEEDYQDTTQHFLSDSCDVSKSPFAQEMWADIKQKINNYNPNSILLSQIVSQKYKSRFLLNPACLSLGQNSIDIDYLQRSGMDVDIKKFFHYRLKYRYKLLKDRGFIVKKRFQFDH